jgi:mRNA-degrading endonuclease toxin of MazEF toxin-antitoxin module
MEPWQIWTWQFEFGEHPAVIISNPDRVQLKPEVVVLSCSTRRANRSPEKFEVLLDETDGLDWATLCRCDLLYTIPKKQLTKHRGTVVQERRRAIAERIVRSLAFAGL